MPTSSEQAIERISNSLDDLDEYMCEFKTAWSDYTKHKMVQDREPSLFKETLKKILVVKGEGRALKLYVAAPPVNLQVPGDVPGEPALSDQSGTAITAFTNQTRQAIAFAKPKMDKYSTANSDDFTSCIADITSSSHDVLTTVSRLEKAYNAMRSLRTSNRSAQSGLTTR